MPTFSSFKTSAQIFANNSSVRFRGADVCFGQLGPAAIRRRQRAAIDLAARRQWQRIQKHEHAGNHVLRKLFLEIVSQFTGSEMLASARHDVGYETFSPGSVFTEPIPRTRELLGAGTI